MLDKILLAKLWLKARAYDLMHDEEGAVDIVAIVVLIGIVVLLAIIFRDKLSELIKNLFDTISGNAEKAVNN